jgi:hypothetical protein
MPPGSKVKIKGSKVGTTTITVVNYNPLGDEVGSLKAQITVEVKPLERLRVGQDQTYQSINAALAYLKNIYPHGTADEVEIELVRYNYPDTMIGIGEGLPSITLMGSADNPIKSQLNLDGSKVTLNATIDCTKEGAVVCIGGGAKFYMTKADSKIIKVAQIRKRSDDT